MDTVRVLIVDDEELARTRLRRLLQKEPDMDVVAECSGGTEAVSCIREHRPTLVYLDVQMSDLDGFGVIEALSDEPMPIIVFVTAYDQYAVRAFETNALDYLLKPFSDKRFKRSLERVRERIQERQFSAYNDRLVDLLEDYQRASDGGEGARSEEAPTYAGRLVLKTGGRLVFVDADQIDWVEAEGVYVRVHTASKSYLLRESLSNVETRLDSRHFLRIHRSTIVNVRCIKEVVPHFNGGAMVTLNNGKQLRLSRSYRDKVSATLG